MTRGRLAGLVAIWAVLVGLVVLELHPFLPSGAWGWALLVAAGPPLYGALELLGSKLFGREAGRRISPPGSPGSASSSRCWCSSASRR